MGEIPTAGEPPIRIAPIHALDLPAYWTVYATLTATKVGGTKATPNVVFLATLGGGRCTPSCPTTATPIRVHRTANGVGQVDPEGTVIAAAQPTSRTTSGLSVSAGH